MFNSKPSKQEEVKNSPRKLIKIDSENVKLEEHLYTPSHVTQGTPPEKRIRATVIIRNLKGGHFQQITVDLEDVKKILQEIEEVLSIYEYEKTK